MRQKIYIRERVETIDMGSVERVLLGVELFKKRLS